MISVMGEMHKNNLPNTIAVRVSVNKWQLAELIGEPDSEDFRPMAYQLIGKKMTQGDCHNALTEIHREIYRKRGKP